MVVLQAVRGVALVKFLVMVLVVKVFVLPIINVIHVILIRNFVLQQESVARRNLVAMRQVLDVTLHYVRLQIALIVLKYVAVELI